ncbi:hypothetical protein [Halobacteriovorax sp.]|uniref:hypothetical protein n=1 Tax=Halobacteriovorax sp. TaxID=2020862 RepID=UPI003561943B
MYKFIIFSLSLILAISCSTLKTSERFIASIHDTRNCVDSINGFMRTNPTKSGPIITGENSLASRIPNFEDFRNQMLASRPSIENFVKKYKDANDQRVPTNLEVIDFFTDYSDKLATHIRSAKGHDERLDLYLEFSAAEIELSPSKLEKIASFKNDAEFRERIQLEYDPRSSDSRGLLDTLGWTNYKGHLGELDVLLRLENLQAQGVYLSRAELLDPKAQVINDMFSSKLEEKFAQVTLENLEEYKEKFPHIFKINEEIEAEEVLKRAHTFLKTKEFDLVVKKNNKYSLVEVKNYKHPIGVRDASEGGGNKKTILDQQLETIEILHFLGLEDTFFPTVAFLRGVTQEARDIFESKGISVLAQVVD